MTKRDLAVEWTRVTLDLKKRYGKKLYSIRLVPGRDYNPGKIKKMAAEEEAAAS